MVRLAWVPQPKLLVVRVDEVGRAEAVAYEAMEAQADPLNPTTGFVVDHYSRRRGTVREYWERSLWFLTPEVANAAYAEQAEDVAATAVGLRDEEVQVEGAAVRILPQPTEPHQRATTFDLVRMVPFHAPEQCLRVSFGVRGLIEPARLRDEVAPTARACWTWSCRSAPACWGSITTTLASRPATASSCR